MLRILESQAPARQTATDTIATLSSRLASATLLEDRRAAILGLRSFAKQYPASVASGALRDLIAGLRRDGQDSDTIKVVLETLLMLFEPDEKSTEASEEITLWLADEFTQRQDNITALLDLLETGEFYLRLYSLQILSHVCGHRQQRTQETVLAAPLGVSRITAVLDDKRDAVRNEALLLLIALTAESPELQKVVAFENAFDRIFSAIEGDGGLAHGTTTVQDCLTLLANLLTFNTSNQTLFRETGFVSRVSKLIAEAMKRDDPGDGAFEQARPQRDMNLWGILHVLQVFLIRGSQGTLQTQAAFWQHRVLLHTLQVAFQSDIGLNVRAKALNTCGDIIRGNTSLQEQFGDLSVQLLSRQSQVPQTNGHSTPGSARKPQSRSRVVTPAPIEVTNVIEALLSLTLEPSPFSFFEVRLAACNCFKAFIENHDGIRTHVLRRAIEGHRSGEDAIPNILNVLLEPSSSSTSTDSYQVWMASLVLFHILYDNGQIKRMAMGVSEGNAEDGEEVVTFIQSLTSNVIAGVQHTEDERALLGYLMLLSIWLFEDPDAVNDLLGEGSNVQGLMAAVKVSSSTMPLVSGLCTLLLGIIYEFSTKDSPIARAALHGLLMKGLTREVYVDRMTKLRESSYVRDFEILPVIGDGGLPEVFFDKTFMNFLKDNFSRLLRAIDREPNYEASIVINGVQTGVSRELVDSLRSEIEDHRKSLESVRSELFQVQQRLQTEELEHRKSREQLSLELNRIRSINENLQRNHEEEVNHLQETLQSQERKHVAKHEATLLNLRRDHSVASQQLVQKHDAEKKYLEHRQSGHEKELARLKEKHKTELEQRRTEAQQAQHQQHTQHETLERSHNELRSEMLAMKQKHDEDAQQLQTSHDEQLSHTEERAQSLHTKCTALETKIRELEDKDKVARSTLSDARNRLAKAEAMTKEAEEKVHSAESRTKQALDRVAKAEERAKTSSKTTKAETQAAARIEGLEKELQELRTKAEKAKSIQTELDDLLVVFADLEVKRATDKKQLKDLGQEVSEDEDDGDDEVNGEEDEGNVD